MKNIRAFSLVLLMVVTNIVFTSAMEQESLLRQWHITGEDKVVEGSFYKFYRGQVYIKEENHSISKFPLYDLSNEDIAFALERHKYDNLMHDKEATQPYVYTDKVSYSVYLLVPLLLAVLMVFMVVNSNRQRMVYFPPKIQRV